jgi:hypothetical protein
VPEVAEISVLSLGPTSRGYCSVCGFLPFLWTDARMAAYDAIGHASAHHAR